MSLELETITNYEKVSTMNANFEAIVEEFLNKLDRVSSEDGNAMEQDLDMNGYTILNAVIDDSTLQETFDSFLEQAESDIDDYVVDTAFPQIDAYSTEVVDTYVTDTVKPEIDTYVVDVSEATIDNYVENTSKPSIDTYVTENVEPYSTLAEQWASEDEDVLVADTDYSAKHYAAKASASASSASTSATEAAGSATEATDIVTALQEDSSFTLTGDATGTGTMDASYQVSIAVDVNSADNATTADALSSAITVELDGDVTGSASTDGSSDVTITTTLDASSIGDLAIPYPDLHIPFNDGLRIESGYGTNDQIDVSAAQDGSVMVDLPSMSADFVRSTGCYYLDKNSNLSYADVDSPCIDHKGLWLHDPFTVWSQYSNLLTDPWWSKVNVEVTDSGETFLGGYPVFDVTLTADSGFRNIRRVATSEYTKGDVVGTTIVAKADTMTSLIINIGLGVSCEYDLSTGVASAPVGDYYNYGMEDLGEGFYACYLTHLTEESEDQIIRYNLTGNTGDNIKVVMINIGDFVSYSPLQYTTDSTLSVTSTLCSVNLGKNISYNKGFTVTAEATAIESCTDGYSIYSINDGLSRSAIRYSAGGLLYNEATEAKTVDGYQGGRYRYTTLANPENNTQELYVNGVLVTNPLWDSSTYTADNNTITLYIGSSTETVWRLNSRLKGLKVFQGKLSSDQIKVLGAAE